MRKAIFISLLNEIIILFLDKIIGYYCLSEFKGYRYENLTAAQITSLTEKKYYSISAVHVLFAVLLYFILGWLTNIDLKMKCILCILTLIVNFLLIRIAVI